VRKFIIHTALRLVQTESIEKYKTCKLAKLVGINNIMYIKLYIIIVSVHVATHIDEELM